MQTQLNPRSRKRGRSLIKGAIYGLALGALGLASAASAQMSQEVAVGVCQAANDSLEVEFLGASFLVQSNAGPNVDFVCPINGVEAPAEDIGSVTVFLGDPSITEDARVEVCVTALHSTPSEICGRPAFSVGAGYFSQAVKAAPPAMPVGEPLNAFIRVHIPEPNPDGYGFLRGFRVDP